MPEDSRFEFGANWSRFLAAVDDARIEAATASLKSMLAVDRLDGKRFLDVGSGSGLFSLAAHRLGASVHSFDYDPDSVFCTQTLKERYAPDAGDWTVEQGSALDEDYLNELGEAEIVYSWGVLHHTGDMWTAIDLVSRRVRPSGFFWLAIYNDQQEVTSRWRRVKRLYQKLPRFLRPLLSATVGAVLLGHRLCRTAVTSVVELITLGNPLAPLQRAADRASRPDPRGMSRWHDLVDWVGGWPFEVARPEEVIDFLADRGFQLVRLRTVGGKMGCNEYLLRRQC